MIVPAEMGVGELLGDRRLQRNGALEVWHRRVESPRIAEHYLNIRPLNDRGENCGAGALYETASAILREHGARIFSERVFAIPDAIDGLRSAREDALSEHDDGVPPTVLIAESPVGGPIAGLQIHAIAGDSQPEPACLEGRSVGRMLENGGRRWAHLAGLTASPADPPERQAHAAYESATQVLGSLGMDLRCVARTWVWIRDILGWYDEFNAARNSVFRTHKLIDEAGRAQYLPASTGIGIGPAGGGACALELLAISDGVRSIRAIESSRDQNSAFSYGSAFARAVVAPMPTGSALFVSGTAAIDERGQSEHEGDARSQVEATIRHIRALLGEVGWGEDTIVSAIAYAKSPEVASVFARQPASQAWPYVELIADVCRRELVFEAELTAQRGASPSGD